MSSSFFSRRGFLEVVGLSAGGFLLKQQLFGNQVLAAGTDPKFMLLVYFGGGWDQLLALDPRPSNDARYRMTGAGKAPTSGIVPNYEDSAAGDANVAAVMTATAGSGVQTRGNLTFGPAVAESMLNHSSDLCIIRGISMDTLTHEVGRRYLLTGKFPRGLAANGSSLNTVVAGQSNSGLDLPNLAVDMESYNEGWPASASATRVGSQNDVTNVLRPQTPSLSAASDGVLKKFEETDDSCDAHGYDATGLVASFRASQAQARTMTNSTKASLFSFTLPPVAGGPVDKLFTGMQISTTADVNGPKGNAAIAAQAITQGISNVVAVSLATNLDDHFDESGAQSVTQRAGWDALGLLIQYLKDNQVPGTSKSFWQCTSMMVFSEFSRTPMMNARDGRDHHLTGSTLISGPGITGNTVFGASTDLGMGTSKWNFTTGAKDDTAGNLIHPQDIHATLLTSMGMTSAHLSNQSPQLIRKLIKTS